MYTISQICLEGLIDAFSDPAMHTLQFARLVNATEYKRAGKHCVSNDTN